MSIGSTSLGIDVVGLGSDPFMLSLFVGLGPLAGILAARMGFSCSHGTNL